MADSNRLVTKKRSAGKPGITRAEQAANSRERILREAIRLFAARGYDGVSVDEVVAKAKINKRMVYHYFGGKEALYSASLGRVFENLGSIEATLFRDEPSAGRAIERIVRAYFKFLQENPAFVSLLLWENLQGGSHLRSLDKTVTKAPILEALGHVIERGIRSGELRKGLHAGHMLITLIGLCLIYFSNRHTLIRTIGLDLNDPRELERGISQAITLAKNGFLQASKKP